ncbi:MAG: hypothetical protein KDE53_33435, partial [Caldilineaceae bacterium]|nr:hypothetical protein [Caldilineaceae bacterium]
DNIKSELDDLSEQIEAMSSSTLTTTSYSNQLASFEQDRLASLETELSSVKALLEAQVAAEPAAEAVLSASGLVSGDYPWAIGLVALAGLALGIVLTRIGGKERPK